MRRDAGDLTTARSALKGFEVDFAQFFASSV